MNKRLFKYTFLAMMISSQAVAFPVIVKDGDSLETGERRIRLDGIDAPEFTQICQDNNGNDYDCGFQSLQYLENLVNGQEVDCQCLPDKDRYHREICECFVGSTSLNKAMVSAGWAVPYRDKTYVEEENKAKENKLGIWQGKHMRPAIYRALNKPNSKSYP